MALPDRLNRLEVDPPPKHLSSLSPLKNKLLTFRRDLDTLMEAGEESPATCNEDVVDAEIARIRLKEIKTKPGTLVTGKKLKTRLNKLLS